MMTPLTQTQFERVNPNAIVKKFEAPFLHWTVDEFLKPDFYSEMARTFINLLARGTSPELAHDLFSKPILGGQYLSNDLQVFMHPIRHDQSPPLGFFNSTEFKLVIENIVDHKVGSFVASAMHHHQINSPSSSIHSDYNLCNFKWSGAIEEAPIPYTGGTIYQYAYDTGPQIQHCCRDLGMVFYLNNDSWLEGDGGETGLYTPDNRLAKRISPLNNRILIFEVTPHSLHSFLANPGSERNNIAIWFHSPVKDVIRKFRIRPEGMPLNIYNQMLNEIMNDSSSEQQL